MPTIASEAAVRPLYIVDDNADDIELLRLLLRKAGTEHPLRVFERADEMLASLSELLNKSVSTLPLLCFLDLGLPGMNGLEILKWIRSHACFDCVSIVMLTSSEHPADIKAAAQHGAQCYLGKYPHPSVLQRVLNEATQLAEDVAAKQWFGIPANWLLRWGVSGQSAPASA
jgi:two-component system, response regulator